MRSRRARRQRPSVGAGAHGVRESRGEEHQLRRLVARIVGAVTEVHACAPQSARAAVDGGADGSAGTAAQLYGIIGAWHFNRNSCPSLSSASSAMAGIAAVADLAAPPRPAGRTERREPCLHPAATLPDFSLIDQHGQGHSAPRNLRGHWSLLFFGYTNCPDFCPTTLTTLAALEKRLRADAAPVLPQVIFVSVDAKRDTPGAIGEVRAVLRSRVHRPHRRRSTERRSGGQRNSAWASSSSPPPTALTSSITPARFSCSTPRHGSPRTDRPVLRGAPWPRTSGASWPPAARWPAAHERFRPAVRRAAVPAAAARAVAAGAGGDPRARRMVQELRSSAAFSSCTAST